ncbi:MAG: serine hydrolase [Oligoflexia bacterium]|nr:serine hydrolase [Oligoflexia bacterium]
MLSKEKLSLMDDLQKLKKLIVDLMKIQHFDSIAVGVLDFSSKKFQSIQFPEIKDCLIFDLASITKALTNGVVAIKYPKLFAHDERDFDNLKLLLNHRAGLPRGGRLSKSSWRQDILKYPIIPSSPTLYSDYSAIRFMLEIEERAKKSYRELLSDDDSDGDEGSGRGGRGFLGGQEIYFWRDLILNKELVARIVQTGERNRKIIQGEVNDDNAFVVNEFLSHAGLFATADSLLKTLLYLDQRYNLLKVMREEFARIKTEERFLLGWDRVENPQKTLAGEGASIHTFGHLGFTGTSCWIDLEKNFAQVILTNATQKYSYSRDGLNLLRREIGKYLWNHGKSILN